MADRKPLTIRAVLFQEDDGRWSAQCLEYDIATQAKTLPDLRYELERVIISHLTVSQELKRAPFAGYERAPDEYWDMFAKADMVVAGKDLPFQTPIPPVVPDLDLRVTNR